MYKGIVLGVGLGLLVLISHQEVLAQGTVFTYEGKLSQNGVPFSGTAEIAPSLWDAPANGNLVGTNNPGTFLVAVSNGLFTASLDFGSAPFAGGAPRWLQLGVRTTADPFSILTPLQPITTTPYAITARFAAQSGFSTNFSGSLAGDVAGGQAGTVVVAVGGQAASAVASAAVAINGATSAAIPGSVARRDASGGLVVGGLSAGNITAVAFSGNGANLTSINSSNLAGTIPLARLSGISSNQLDLATWQEATRKDGGMAALATNVVSGIFITNATITGSVFSGNGANLTSINSSNLTGTIPLARLSGITSNQVDAATWQFIVNNASGLPSGMVVIPYGGPFTMGDPFGGLSDSKSVTNVLISPFYMDVNLVTWEQWQVVYGYATNHGYTFVNPGAGKGAAHPVQNVNWYSVAKWCNARSEQAGKLPVYYTDAGLTAVYRSGEVTPYANWSAKGYRLPTEAEWEKAARGGLPGLRFPWGNLISETNGNYIGATNFYAYDSGPNGYNPIGSIGGTFPATTPVGSFAPNGYGLYDMAGNVFQWCWDWYGTPYAGGSDPHGAASGSLRVLRGGSWNNYALYSQCAYRSYLINPGSAHLDFGFRCVRGD